MSRNFSCKLSWVGRGGGGGTAQNFTPSSFALAPYIAFFQMGWTPLFLTSVKFAFNSTNFISLVKGNKVKKEMI